MTIDVFSSIIAAMMSEPFRTLYWLLQVNSFPSDIWLHNVRMRADAIYIGTDQHHITVLRRYGGWHVTINGHSPGQIFGDFQRLIERRWDVTPEIDRALGWFRLQHRNNVTM